MNFKRILSINYWLPNYKLYIKYLKDDSYAFSTFRGGSGILSKREKMMIEYRALKAFRKYQSNYNTIWKFFYSLRLKHFQYKYGMEFANPSIGRGFVIGHWGRIVINGNSKIGDQFMVTHGVTIGRDIRGKRKGIPIIGDRVAVRANSTIVGNVVIGDDVLIAPNTFVNFNVPNNSIVIGNPAKIISREKASEGHVGKIPE